MRFAPPGRIGFLFEPFKIVRRGQELFGRDEYRRISNGTMKLCYHRRQPQQASHGRGPGRVSLQDLADSVALALFGRFPILTFLAARRGCVATAAAVALLAAAVAMPRTSLAQAELGVDAAAALALKERMSQAALEQAFPGAEGLEVIGGRPPALAVIVGGEVAGYLFSTKDTVKATGYAGTAFDLVAGMSPDGEITGAVLLWHAEAIIGRGVPEGRLEEFIAGFAAASLNDFGAVRPDLLNRATVSGRTMKAGVRAAARMVHAGHVTGSLNEDVAEPTLDRRGFVPLSVEELRAAGSITSTRLSVREAIAAFENAGGVGARPERGFVGARTLEDSFVDLTTTLLTPASIGGNLYGYRRFEANVLRGQEEGGLTMFLGSNGLFSFASNSHFQEESGYLFDRIKIVQNGREFRLSRDHYRRVSYAPGFTFGDTMLFHLPADFGLDPLQPYDIVLMIPGKNEAGEPIVVEHTLTYALPDIHKLLPPPPPVPLWVEAWTASQTGISVLAGLLLLVTAVFVFQDSLVRRRRVYNAVRVGVLAFTLGWLGFYMGGQLSVVNLWAYVQAPLTGTGLDTFLLDPLIFILAVYTLVTLFVLGRGVFCGWLCPFGSLQELLNKAARVVRLPQLRVPPVLQERLWAVKYLAAVVVIGLVFFSVEWADRAGEIEPFKTVITVKLDREWPFVAYALVLLGLGLFIERFFCRFLCPLGASLGVVGRLRMFNWLKRKPQCGTECRICETDCPMGAILPSGRINMSECLQCLDCQVDYYDDTRCPPLIGRKRRRAVRQRSPASAPPTAVRQSWGRRSG